MTIRRRRASMVMLLNDVDTAVGIYRRAAISNIGSRGGLGRGRGPASMSVMCQLCGPGCNPAPLN